METQDTQLDERDIDECDFDEWFEQRLKEQRSLPSDGEIDPSTLVVAPLDVSTFRSMLAPQLRDVLAQLLTGPRTVVELAEASARRLEAVARDVDRLDWMGLVHTVPLGEPDDDLHCLVGVAWPTIDVETGELLGSPNH
jgi:hypothetical protein